jgi:hypothetical protein
MDSSPLLIELLNGCVSVSRQTIEPLLNVVYQFIPTAVVEDVFAWIVVAYDSVFYVHVVCPFLFSAVKQMPESRVRTAGSAMYLVPTEMRPPHPS